MIRVSQPQDSVAPGTHLSPNLSFPCTLGVLTYEVPFLCLEILPQMPDMLLKIPPVEAHSSGPDVAGPTLQWGQHFQLLTAALGEKSLAS